MTCEHCERAATGALSAVAGVEHVRVDATASRAWITCNDEPDRKVLDEVVADEGFVLQSVCAARP